ncbi:MAG: type II toxin-antitoxin system Phd/YefM family antitoxin [Tessaracoccus sp.]|uniref:type II toxin-antitoxin system Phd/YefM family antitoxin n=1 Tax=Tessaracoccus sp. TaxID=1971211 RepID=UPI001EC219F2|nr:type II toxin-antitoxin system Phd/YefM family antitoxin [Tessaracoccus sp.]MBK7822297.1 type II toxin-antitoxin system Phd/YefM family antitoxin [Tessaracoccus sp.]
MKTISVGQLRQNPSDALAEVERGETYLVTRHRREIGRLVPPPHNHEVSPEAFLRAILATPIDPAWADELSATRSDFDGDSDPWAR